MSCFGSWSMHIYYTANGCTLHVTYQKGISQVSRVIHKNFVICIKQQWQCELEHVKHFTLHRNGAIYQTVIYVFNYLILLHWFSNTNSL